MKSFVLIANLSTTYGKTSTSWRLQTLFGSRSCILVLCLIAIRNRGNKGGVDAEAHAGMISPPEAEEGWLHGLWKLCYLCSEDVLTLAILPEAMRWIDSAAGAATCMAKWIG